MKPYASPAETITDLLNERTALHAENASLKAALAQARRAAIELVPYACHRANCQINHEWQRHKGCDCGLMTKIAEAKSLAGEQQL